MPHPQTAPVLPVQTHWSFSNEADQEQRRKNRRIQAAYMRAKRDVQAILGGVIYHSVTGIKPQLSPVRSAPKRVLTLQDLL